MSYKKLSRKSDLAYGLSKEEEVRIKLTSFFQEPLINTKDISGYDEFTEFDFIGLITNDRFEVKSRRCTKEYYLSTYMPLSKVSKESIRSDLYFVFNFTDKLCYIKYYKPDFDKYNIKDVKCLRDGQYEYKLEFDIPIDDLIDID